MNFVSVKLKCVHCGHALMDHEHLVDNVASIKLYVKIGEQEGYVWLSSIYGSYNLDSSFEIQNGDVAQFKCPECFHELKSEEVCDECGAHMVDFHLEDGGKVSVCSRAGCKKHLIQFEDLGTALNHFYNEYELEHNAKYKTSGANRKPKPEPSGDKEVLESGTFLNSYCPHCKMSLISDNKIIFKVEKNDGSKGILFLSPYLNVFTHASTIKLMEKSNVSDIKCIYCDHSLVHESKSCPECGSLLARINVSAMRRLIDFYFCTQKGCRWHGLSDEDLNFIRLEDSQEW